MTRFTPYAYAILRIVAGLLFVTYGTQKLLGVPTPPPQMPHPLPPIVIAAGTIELVCGLAIALGLFTRIAAFIASGEMAVAYFIGHAGHGGFWPIQNHGEPAVLFCFAFLYFAAHGAGVWSIDDAMA
jgi:putative oxidoreductase